MEYHVFTACLKECVEALCPDSDQVLVQKVLKNNSLELDGLVIQKEGYPISPTIYLNEFYNCFLQGRSLTEIAKEIIEIDATNRCSFEFPIETFCDFQQIKSRIVYKLVNTERNRALLEKIPHRDYLDCSIIYYCFLDKINGSCATTLIYYSHMERWNVQEEDLFQIASLNTPVIHPADLKSMDAVLTELIQAGDFDEEDAAQLTEELSLEGDRFPMYVLTNKERIFGASCILYDNILKEFAQRNGSFYILPSSIHEVILVPEQEELQADKLTDMVLEVNETQVAHDEVLSDSVYCYHADTGLVQLLCKQNFVI